MRSWMEKVLEYGVCSIVFIVPLLYFGGNFFIPYVTSKTFVFYGLVEILFAIYLYQIFIKRLPVFNLKDWSFFAPVLAFLIWITISGIFGVNPERSFWSSLGRGTGLITWYHLLALSFIIATLVRCNGNKFVNRVFFWFLNGSFVLALSVWLGDEGLNLPVTFLERSKGGGLIGNSSLAASYFIFSLFFGILLLFSKTVTRRVKIWTSLILGLIIFSPLFINLHSMLTGKFFISARAALLSIFIGIIMSLLVWMIFSGKRYVKITGWFGLLIGIFLSFSVLGMVFVKDSYVQKRFVDNATASRLIFWDIAWQGIKEKPVLGWGPENYSVVYQKYFNPEILKQSSTTAEIWVDRAHNILFDLGVAGGLPAVISYLLIIMSLIFVLIRDFRDDLLNRGQVSILTGLIVAYFVQNFFVFDSLSSLLGLFVLIAVVIGGISSRAYKGVRDNQGQLNQIKAFLIPALLIMFLISLTFFVFLPLKKVRAISEIFTAPLNQRPDRYSELLKISPVGDNWEIGGLAEDSSTLYRANLDKIKKDQKLFVYAVKDLEKIIEYLNTVAQKEKDDYRLHLNLLRLNVIYANLGIVHPGSSFKDKLSDLAAYTKSLSPNHFNLIFKVAK